MVRAAREDAEAEPLESITRAASDQLCPMRRLDAMAPIDFKASITQDIAEIDLALSVLNSLRDVNLARLALLQEAEKRSEEV